MAKQPASAPDADPEEREVQGKRIPAIFFRTEGGREPLRDWLRQLPPDDRKRVGEDIKTVEFGWPIGMPYCKAMGMASTRYGPP